MSLKAGKLRHRITIQKKVRTQDSTTGAMVLSWVSLATGVPAAVDPLSAREFIASQAMTSEVQARITIRYRDDVDASMRVLHRGKIYVIKGVLSDNKSGLDYLTLPVAEGVRDD